MKTIHACSTLLALLASTFAWAEGTVPPELAELTHKDLKESQQKMQDAGWEIVHSSFFSKKQYWWNDSSKSCVSLKIDGKTVGSFSTIAEKECTSRLADARKVWANHFDGQTNLHSAGLDAEREKLTAQGYQATYWVKEPAKNGRSGEYWWNAQTGKCAFVLFETNSGKWLENVESDAKQCKNPAPRKR